MKVLAIDFGTRYLGLAIAETKINIAFPYKILENREMFNLDEIRAIIKKEKIKKIIIGQPIGMSGKKTEQTKITDKFIKFLKDNLLIPVESFDERLSSKMAIDTRIYADQNADKRGYIRENQRRDQRKSAHRAPARPDEHAAAAAVILQGYLEKTKNKR